jgi:MFS family permease
VFAIGCVACGLAKNMTQLIIARAFAGIGGGGMQTCVIRSAHHVAFVLIHYSLVSIVVSDLVPLRERGTWQGRTRRTVLG